MSKLYFLTFANTSYMKPDRIINQANEFGIFDHIIAKSEKDIPEFVYKHRHFINANMHGYGRWIWKPKVIFDLLGEINDNDMIVYCDAGMYLNSKGCNRLRQYLNAINDKKVICVFNTSDNYKAQHFVKNDAIMSYYPQFNNEMNICCYAGLMIVRKTDETIKLIRDWLELCENYHFLDNSPSVKYNETSNFRGQDADNGLFNLVISKYKNVVHAVYPDETNIYVNNNQIVHVMKDYKQSKVDWSPLDNFPFQCRRMTPNRDN